MRIEEYKYNNAVIRIRGEVNKKKLEEATAIFLKKCIRKGIFDEYKTKTRDIKK